MRYINISSILDLRHGDIIKHKGNGITYTVLEHYGTRVTAIRIADVTNPMEWGVLRNEPIERGCSDDYPVIDLKIDSIKDSIDF